MKEIFTKTHFTNRIIWILLIWFALYEIVDSILVFYTGGYLRLLIQNMSDGLDFVLQYYTPLIVSCLFFVLLCLIVKKNRFMISTFRPSREGKSMKMLGIGLPSRRHQAILRFLRVADPADDFRAGKRVLPEHI